MNPYLGGYYAASQWNWPRFACPWGFFMVAERCAWPDGWDDANRDARAGRIKPKLEPECVR
jgi:hypothetical protein